MTKFPHLAQRLFNTPIAILPDKAEMVMAALADRLGVAHLFRGEHAVALVPMAFDQEDESFEPAARIDAPPDRGYDVVAGVALIEIAGTLTHRLGCIRPYSGQTGYDGIRLAFLSALGDPEVRAIALDINSPGGEVAGCFDLADTIRAARGLKPIWGILNEAAYSAAYALASACDHITVPRTGGAGSVGVIVMHVDMSRALEGSGVAVTLLTYGDRKADGNEFEPLAKAARTRFQAEIDTMGELFVATVARNRGIDAAAVRAQQAATFLGSAAVTAGLADAVMAPDQALAALVETL